MTWYKRNSTWRVRIKGRLIGNFKTLDDAVAARDRADPSYAEWRVLTAEERAVNRKKVLQAYADKVKKSPVLISNRQDANKKYKSSAKGIAARKAYDSTPEAKAAHARVTGRVVNRIGIKIHKMLREGGVSGTVLSFTEFASDDDTRAFFEASFEPWMSWANYGTHKKGAELESAWNIGHKIPRSAYDHSNEDDIRRCWSRMNLFAQDAKQNANASDRLPNSCVLLSLRPVWPLAWNDSLPV